LLSSMQREVCGWELRGIKYRKTTTPNHSTMQR
jgi:hypothetical protein